jgi:hypothetical protein
MQRSVTTLAVLTAMGLGMGSVTSSLAATASSEAINNATIEADDPNTQEDEGGPAGSPQFFNAQGNDDGFVEFGVADFDGSAFQGSAPAVGIESMSLTLTESNAFFSNAGGVQVMLTEDTSTAYADLAADTSDDPDAVGSQLSPKGVVATGQYNQDGDGTTDVFEFSLTSAQEDYLVNQINNGNPIRTIVAANELGTAATYAGYSNGQDTQDPSDDVAGPTLSATTTIPEPTSAALLALGGSALIFRRRKQA